MFIMIAGHCHLYRFRSRPHPGRGQCSPPRYAGGCSNAANPPHREHCAGAVLGFVPHPNLCAP